ncbi:enoyl-CoA hydratase/isomerase family protein [Marinomonas sp. A79]|uniref:Enoyl-CoA hydratase/isomerase family protein n=1 Tax=Marinomonas vulgaris TaxID=2823372 RepID=A0ABS5HAC7_9GAMM|nr:enoyl-CoA hydratase-related protein [Marinomonas vulgaris]MBR7888407.1 enoyl-CoA hydratase/isomerase family protein [Marinomonas vulgaris]
MNTSMTPTFDHLLLTQSQDDVWLITIDRPTALNALNKALLASLSQAFYWLDSLPTTKVILLTGSGDKAFVAGADVAAMQSMTALEAREFSHLGMALMHQIEACAAPVIALVNGFCLGGGCELALSCDYILASENAVFGQPEVSLGITPGFGGTQRLARSIGKGNAMQWILTGDRISAQDALKLTVCSQVFSPDELLKSGLAQAEKIAKNAPHAVRFAKQLIHQGVNMSLQDGCQLETERFALCFTTQDQTEGMAAFIERRPARFSHQ